MDSSSFSSLFVVTLFVLSSCLLALAQQPYVGKATTDCLNTDPSTSVLGYTCNGINTTCQAYLIFRSQPSYDTVSTISNLLSADPSQVASINSVSETATFGLDKMVIVPVNCSCSGQYYQADTSYSIQQGDIYFLVANNTYEGLSTCQALQDQNDIAANNLYVGARINVPLRCACPSKIQSDAGVKYLLSYLVATGDTVSDISLRFGVDTALTLEANGLSFENSTIYPSTTLLVPMEIPPSSSQTVSPPPPPPPPLPSPTPGSSKSSNKTWVYVVIGIAIGSGILVSLGIVFYFRFSRCSKRKDLTVSKDFESVEKSINKNLHDESLDFMDSLSSVAQSMKIYNYKELQLATDNFSPEFLINRAVYRGNFNGDLAAIKKMNGDVLKEIDILNKINHFNLIRLSGICFHDGDWYFIYEYAANGPLTDWIFSNSLEGKSLSWIQRVNIALDVATGLNYLHSYTIPPHVHKDIKCSSILLDDDFRAKIKNLSAARSTEGEGGQFVLTRHIVGTKGYMAPEYLDIGLVSVKLDVYAFGVLMLEMITGKDVASLLGDKSIHPIDALNDVLREDDGHETLVHFIDLSLQENYPVDLALFFMRIIESCLQEDPSARPNMDEVVQSLSKVLTASVTWELSQNQ